MVNQKRIPFVLFLSIALAVIWLTLPLADNFGYSNGKELVAWYIPLPVSLLYFLLNLYTGREAVKSAWLTLVLFLLLLIPFIPQLTDTYKYYEQDDGTRYRMVATNMVKHHTLNAGDGAIFGTQDKVYMIQPGYRYYLALWIRIFGEEMRLYQVFNMLVYLAAIVLLFIRSAKVAVPAHFRTGTMAFVLLSSNFVVKLIMMVLTEWLAISIFLLAVSFYVSRHLLLAIILMALMPFLRQNLFFVSLFILCWMVIKEKRKALLVIVYLGILLLPLYHNLYYAGKWQFFSVYDDPSTFTNWDFEGSSFVRLLKNVLYHISLYSGINIRLNNFFANALSLACIPLGTYLVVRAFFYLEKNSLRWYLLIVSTAIVPTLIFGGTAYYPRFEWVNIFIGIGSFIVIKSDAGRKNLFPLAVHKNV